MDKHNVSACSWATAADAGSPERDARFPSLSQVRAMDLVSSSFSHSARDFPMLSFAREALETVAHRSASSHARATSGSVTLREIENDTRDGDTGGEANPISKR